MATDWRLLAKRASALRDAGRLHEAADAYVELLSLRPNLPESWYNLGWLQRRLGRFTEALAAYERALETGVRDPEEVHLNRGVIFSDHLMQPEAARAEYETALRLNPAYWQAHFNLGNLDEDKGDRAGARAHYGRVLELQPLAFEALARLANLSDVTDESDPVIQQVRAALARPDLSIEDKASLGFALGRALDAAGAYDAAFSAYASANASSRQASGASYDQKAEEAVTARLIAAFPGGGGVTGLRAPRPQPVFVCGMFRSGSTLTEQILAGHPRVTAGGELDLIASLIRGPLAPFPESVAGVADFEPLARAYLDQLSLRFPGADIVTDKRPDNYRAIGLIKQMFPDAKIVHTTRHPLDNVLSVFFLHLDQSMSYALDLVDAAHQFREYRRLMAHWRSLYGADIYDFDYDAFVRAPRAAAAGLLQFLGLEWNEECLAFHRRSNAVKTASVWQVREPLYARSSGRWRNYERQLASVRDYLADLLAGRD